jgi:predicted DNA binding CopG/RHH family protein
MAIIRKPTVGFAGAALEQFIEGAPDGAQSGQAAAQDGVQITLRMSREQLERLSQMARRQGIPRASYIKRAVFLQLEADEQGK